MAEQWNPNNLPTLPDGSPNPAYRFKAPPGYVGPNQQELALLGSLGYNGPGQGYQQGMANLGGAYGQGGFSAVLPYLGRLADFAGKGKQMGADYETAATKRLQLTGQEALRGIQSQMGGQGALGSTAHLGGLGDLAAKYGAERANISATATQMGENAMMNRLGMGIQGLGQLGGLASYEQMNNANIGAQQAGLDMQQQGMGFNQNLAALGAQQQYRQEPMQWAYQMWPGGGSPNAASGGGGRSDRRPACPGRP